MNSQTQTPQGRSSIFDAQPKSVDQLEAESAQRMAETRARLTMGRSHWPVHIPHMDAPHYPTPQRRIIETDFLELGRQTAYGMGYTLTKEQARELAFKLAGNAEPLTTQVAKFCGQLVYDLDNEHPTHTWGRWAHAVENDETLPGETYTEWVESRRHTGVVFIGQQQYTADTPTRQSLDAYFTLKTGRLKPGLTSEQFDFFVRHHVAEGRLRLVESGPVYLTGQ